MLQLRRSLLRQSKPSIRTAAGLCPNFILTHPPPAIREDGDGEGGAGDDSRGSCFSLLNCASWITGFEALLGGDPQKNGGDEAAWFLGFSAP